MNVDGSLIHPVDAGEADLRHERNPRLRGRSPARAAASDQLGEAAEELAGSCALAGKELVDRVITAGVREISRNQQRPAARAFPEFAHVSNDTVAAPVKEYLRRRIPTVA